MGGTASYNPTFTSLTDLFFHLVSACLLVVQSFQFLSALLKRANALTAPRVGEVVGFVFFLKESTVW